MKKDYYEILGVPKDSTVPQIKKAYRSLALKHHPDRVPAEQKKEAEEKFKEISEAYGVLSDPQKRQMYDQYGHQGIDQRYTAEDIFKGADFSSVFGDTDLGDIFSQFLGGAGFDLFGGSSSRQGGTRVRRGRDIQYEIEISLEEAYTGVKKKITVPRHEHCEECKGTGAKKGTALKTCKTCNGNGQVVMSSGFFRMAQTCTACGGRGQTIQEPCPQCHGQGVVRVTRSIEVNIPEGVDNDSRLRVRGEGEVGGGGAGDLFLYIRIRPHAFLERAGKDLQMNLPLSFVIAALGGEVSVPTLGGNVMMKIPAGTQSGKIFRLRGKGMSELHGGNHGDQYVRAMIQVPTHLSSEQKKILEQFAQISGEKTEAGGSFTEKIKKVFK
ncbi:MAG: molecular chaperone DnaJ [Candidatus Omnitrophica bacterium]|nr:molecular chaperone DnaJ [Candidatus Omnitrophota bacterium]